jgi:hypothetical protein
MGLVLVEHQNQNNLMVVVVVTRSQVATYTKLNQRFNTTIKNIIKSSRVLLLSFFILESKKIV